MPTTNNANIPNIDQPLTLVSCEGFVASRVLIDLDSSLYPVFFETDVRALDAEIGLVSSEGFAYQATVVDGDLMYAPLIEAEGGSVEKNIAHGDVSIAPVSMSAGSNRAVGVFGDATIGRLVSMDGDILPTTSLTIDASLALVGSSEMFWVIGEAATSGTTPNNYTVVLNLRTKAHCLFDASTESAYAITGELLFGSYKNKNVSDAFVLGRSDDSIALTAWNDEATSREYQIDYKSGAQANLQNKKKALAKGLTGTNWKFKVAKEGNISAEVRGIDLFVSELRRHV